MAKLNGKVTQAVAAGLSLPPDKYEEVFWDGRLPGFGVRLRRLADGTVSKWFFVQYRNAANVSRKHQIGRYGAPWTADEARKRARELLLEAEQGIDPTAAAKMRRAEKSLRDAFAGYMEDRRAGRKALAPGTLRDYETVFRNHVDGRLGGCKLTEVVREDVEAVRSALAKAGKGRTGDKVVLLLKSVYAWVNEQGAPVASPVASLKVAPTRHAAQAIRDDQLHAVLLALREEANGTARDALTALLFTGARRGNVLAMRWEHLNLSASTWYMPTTKNGQPHAVGLSPVLVEMLRARQAAVQSPWVFPGTGEAGHYREPFKAWERVQRRAELHLLLRRLADNGITEQQKANERTGEALARLRRLAEAERVDTLHTVLSLRIHDLRATFATLMAAGGQSTVAIAASLGQRTLAMAQRYTQLQVEHRQEAANAVASRILAAADLTGTT